MADKRLLNGFGEVGVSDGGNEEGGGKGGGLWGLGPPAEDFGGSKFEKFGIGDACEPRAPRSPDKP